MSLFVLSSCASVRFQRFSTERYPAFADIPPAKVTLKKYHNPRNDNLKEKEYYTSFLSGIQRMRNRNYTGAILLFSRCIKDYDDEGNAFFMRARCYSVLGQASKAVNDYLRAQQCGYEEEKTVLHIFDIYQKQGYAALKRKEWATAIASFKAALLYLHEDRIARDILHLYARLAETQKGVRRVITYLHAYNYLKKYQFTASPEFHDLAYGLGNAVQKSGDKYLISLAIPRLLYSVSYPKLHKEKPYLHQMLGFLYTLLGKDKKARMQFNVVMQKYPGSKECEESTRQYQALGKSKYKYYSRYLFIVKSDENNINSIFLQFILSLPQNVDAQKTSAPQIYLNGLSMPYSLKKDQNGALFASLKLAGKVHKGTNELQVKSTITKVGRRFSVSKIKKYSLKDYNRSSERYKMLTVSTPIVRINSPLVRRILRDLRKQLKTDNVHDIVKTVYYYVIDRLSYKLYDNKNRIKKDILDRLQNVNTGVCEDYATLTAAILRGFGIPASCYTGPMLNEKIGHAWPVFYLPDFSAVTVDTTWGDSPVFRDYYLYYASNLTVASQTLYDSNVLSEAGSLRYSSDSRLKVKVISTSTRLTRASE